MVKVRLINSPDITGEANEFNITEVIVYYDGENGHKDSEYPLNLEALINDKWITLKEAFKNHDLIYDIYNTNFFEPKDEEERKRGYRI